MAKLIFSVDDSNVINVNLDQVLVQAGYEHFHAFNGLQAKEKLKTIQESGKRISLILCDVNMPEMNGLEFLQWYKAIPENRLIPVVMLTTESEIPLMQKAKALGATGWVIKPFEESQLLDVIRKFAR